MKKINQNDWKAQRTVIQSGGVQRLRHLLLIPFSYREPIASPRFMAGSNNAIKILMGRGKNLLILLQMLFLYIFIIPLIQVSLFQGNISHRLFDVLTAVL